MNDEQIVSKADFAQMANVTRGRVTQWVKCGQIPPEAIVGEGRRARVRVAVAMAGLKRRLNIDQLHSGNGLRTRLNATAFTVELDDIAEKIALERLEALRSDNRRRSAEEAARSGRFVLASDVAQEMGRLAQRLKSEFDSRQQVVVRALFAANASATAAGQVLKERDFLHIAASASKSWGAAASASAATAVMTIPEQVFHEDSAVADAEADE
jgi:hypothetical protein